MGAGLAMADVTILGAGIFGLSVAWACQKRGAKVRIIDPNGIGAGSSGGIVGALAPHVPENWNPKKAFQLDSLLMAEAYWQEVEAVSGRSPGYARTGRLQPIADDKALQLARDRAKSAADRWQGRATWTVEEACGDWCPPSPTGFVIRDTLSARIHPRNACAALAEALRIRGAEYSGEATGRVVHATGWQGLQGLSDTFERNLGNGVKGQALLLDHAAPDAPQLFADALHIVPHSDGTVAVGSTSERAFDNPTGTDALLDAIHERAIQAFPVLAKARVLERWAGVRPRAKSRAPMLGHWPGQPGHFVANGGFKIGFGVAPKVGEVMADLVLEGQDHIPDGFRVEDNL